MINIELLIEKLETLNIDIDFSYLAPLIEDVETYDDITYVLDANDSLNVDIIYYSTAMEYLSDNDSSLTESLTLAHDLGFEVSNLNSETLASIHASERQRNDWYALEDEVNQIIEECEIEEEEEDDE